MLSSGLFLNLANITTLLAESLAPSDLFAVVMDSTRLPSFLEERAISDFLNRENETDGTITAYSFAAPDLAHLSKKLAPKAGANWRLADASGSGEVGGT